MKIKVKSSELSRLEELAESVIELYKSKLFYFSFFEMKLRCLTVTIYDGSEIVGLYMRKNSNLDILFMMPIDVNEKDFCFALAHELGHLCFDPVNIEHDYCESDASVQITNIIRKSDDGKEYGKNLEESLADFFAVNIVALMYNMSYDEAKKSIPDNLFSREKLELAEKIIKMFSKKDFDKEDFFDQKIICDENCVTDKNALLSEAISGGNMSTVIEDYDECMGKGAWKYLITLFDSYKCANNVLENNTLSKIETEIRSFYNKEQKERS